MPTSRDTATATDTATPTESAIPSDSATPVDSATGIIGLFREAELSGAPAIEPAGGFTIDCDCCALRSTNACDDCVVSFLLEREPDDAVVIDADEARAMRMLERAGLVPTLRFSTQAG